ncbi:unnamed protein product [Cylicocyclus nassatus]|uniref:Alpha-1,3/1,6-mannosyltransferase ALG2 n=1 Tax=Cylicocyclus nassatus TaxID=53992 RepID=A0AA36ME49_CYLNA|nr:unnamed protein product [Cylicocyclus nassatus]
MRVTFLHPDLGIGGAERLVVDAAVALQQKGHTVKVVTSQFDPSHAFKETQQLDIKVIQWFPRLIFGRMWALCAYIRMCLAAIYTAMFIPSDVIICDQVSAALLVLRVLTRARLVFYCHFPDLLLTSRETVAKSFYRYFLDSIEEYTTGLAGTICVNSLFTASVFKQTFRSLQNRELTVLYPSLNTDFFDKTEECTIPEIPPSAEHLFTSLNRYEVKKNLKLAIEAFAVLRTLLTDDEFSKCHLVLAGGYDRLNSENKNHFKELVEYTNLLSLPQNQVTLLRSPSDEEKITLLRRSLAVLYTPHNEHFGIVPIEAMYVGTPVIAVNSGGPKESIVHLETGLLAEQTAEAFAEHMAMLLHDESLRKKLSEMGPKRVRQLFAFEAFANHLDQIVKGDQ